MLDLIKRQCEVVALVAQDDHRSDWAREEVSGWITFKRSSGTGLQNKGSTSVYQQDFQSALKAVEKFISGTEQFGKVRHHFQTTVKEGQSTGTKSRLVIDGVMCYDEFGLELTAYLSDALNLPGTPLKTVQKFRSKHQFREHCQELELETIKYQQIKSPADIDRLKQGLAAATREFQFPAVLKPVKGAGSWHVRKIESLEELCTIYSKISKDLATGSFPNEIKEEGFILEEYFEGWEVDIDGYAVNGELVGCVISDNQPAVEPFFLEVGGTYPSNHLASAELDALYELTKSVLTKFEGVHGCFHFEAKVNSKRLIEGLDKHLDKKGMPCNCSEDSETPCVCCFSSPTKSAEIVVMPIELNLRIGGAECPYSIEAVTGINLPTVAAKIALGQDILDVLPVMASSYRKGIYLSETYQKKLRSHIPRKVHCKCCNKPSVGFHGSDTALLPSTSMTGLVMHRFVSSRNFYAPRTGLLTELSFNTQEASKKCKVVQCILFSCSVGKTVEVNNGSKGCLGWIATGGNTEEEAKKNLRRAMKHLAIKVE